MSSETPQPIGAPPDETEKIHRRQTRLQIGLPLYGAGFLILLLVAGTVAVSIWRPQPGQISMVADILTTVCMLLPLALCMLPVYLLLMVAAFGMGSVNESSARQLRRVNALSRTITEKTITATHAIDQRTLETRARLAGVEKAMDSAFNKKIDEDEEENTHATD